MHVRKTDLFKEPTKRLETAI